MRLLLPFGPAVLLLIAACGGSDETPANPTPASEAPPSVVPGTGGPGNAPPPTSGEPAPADPGSTPNAPPTSGGGGAFEGAAPYVPTLGPSTIDLTGKGNGHLSFSNDGNPAGKACLDCHDGAGKGGAPAFAFAGTVFADAAGTKPAARIEVRIVGADDKATSVYTDENGNFFLRAGTFTVAAPATAGARSATKALTMSNKLNDANCNQCHGAEARITL